MAVATISIQIRSDLTFEPERGPQSDSDLQRIADDFAQRIEGVLSQRLRAHPHMRTAHVHHGPVDMVVHTGLISFEQLEQFESARQLLTEQRQTIEKALKLTWEKHHRGALRSATVSLAPRQTSSPQPDVKPSSFEAFQQEAAMHAAARRNAYIIGGLAGAAVGAFLMWGYLQYAFLREEVATLRDDVRSTQEPEPQQPVVVVYPDVAPVRVPPAPPPPPERRSRYHNSRDASD